MASTSMSSNVSATSDEMVNGSTKSTASRSQLMLNILAPPTSIQMKQFPSEEDMSVNSQMGDSNSYHNYIGELQEYCIRFGLPQPKYEELMPKGPSHERQFTVRVRLQGQFDGEGIGRTKQKAKNNAAMRAVEWMKNPNAAREENNLIDIAEISNGFKKINIAENQKTGSSEDDVEAIAGFYDSLSTVKMDKFEVDDKFDFRQDYCNVLNEMAKELHCRIEYKSHSMRQCLVLLRSETKGHDVIVCHGCGNVSPKLAMQLAAFDVVKDIQSKYQRQQSTTPRN